MQLIRVEEGRQRAWGADPEDCEEKLGSSVFCHPIPALAGQCWGRKKTRSRVRERSHTVGHGLGFLLKGWGWESPGTGVGGKTRLAGRDLDMVRVAVFIA